MTESHGDRATRLAAAKRRDDAYRKAEKKRKAEATLAKLRGKS